MYNYVRTFCGTANHFNDIEETFDNVLDDIEEYCAKCDNHTNFTYLSHTITPSGDGYFLILIVVMIETATE